MPNKTLKVELIDQLISQIKQKILELSIQIRNTELAQQNDVKSSAGDKFETGREILQAELNKYEGQRKQLEQSVRVLHTISPNKRSLQIEFGSLVQTQSVLYFISIGLGNIEINNHKVVAISLASPLGQALKGLNIGQCIKFRGADICIKNIY